jgi:hypothetical protein
MIAYRKSGEHPIVRRNVDGNIVWAPALEGAVVLTTRGGDFELNAPETLFEAFYTVKSDGMALGCPSAGLSSSASVDVFGRCRMMALKQHSHFLFRVS